MISTSAPSRDRLKARGAFYTPPELTRFLASVSRDIPWHVTAFHSDYRMTEPCTTSRADLLRAAEIGREEGLNFVYAGNLPGKVGAWENTRCPNCHETLIDRFGYLVRKYRLTPGGKCPGCGTAIPGIWPATGAAEVTTGESMSDYYSRLPRGVRVN